MPPEAGEAKRRVRVYNRQRLVPVARRSLESVVGQVLEDEDVPRPLGVEITLVRDRAIHPVNRDYLGKDRPTDVLAFPYVKRSEWKRAAAAPGAPTLGEVLVSTDHAVSWARSRRVHVGRAVAHLVLHGVLHLMGYDHKHDADERRMRRMERRYLDRWRRLAPRAG